MIRAILLLCLLGLFGGTESAWAEKAPGYLWLEWGHTFEGANDAYLEAGLPLGNGHRVILGGSYPLEADGTRSMVAGLSLVMTRNHYADFFYSYWGESGVFKNLNGRLSYHFKPSWGRLSVSAETGRTYLYTRFFQAGRNRFGTRSYGGGARLTYYLRRRWEAIVSGDLTEYSADLTELTTPRSTRVFSERGLALVSGLSDQRFSWELGYLWDQLRLGARQTVSRYVTDASRAINDDLLIDWYPARSKISLGLQLGRVRGEFATTRYLRVSISTSWR